jgi:hypothetical protein
LKRAKVKYLPEKWNRFWQGMTFGKKIEEKNQGRPERSDPPKGKPRPAFSREHLSRILVHDFFHSMNTKGIKVFKGLEFPL